jgi:NTP pyrophosphatase (non-canonical NTP hydrolase)
MTIKELCKISHAQAVAKGFWKQVKDKNGKIIGVAERNKSELLMLVVSELGEACEALRQSRLQSNAIYDYKNGEHIKDKTLAKTRWVKDTYEDEIADCFIRLADLCQAQGIDIEWQIKNKLKFNSTRPTKHGKKF